jgi:5-methylcytosine-specific restriction endonuclease McrA
MSINYQDETVFRFPKGASRYESKKARKTAEEAERRRVYAAVDRRDGRICRICRKRADPHALGLLDRAEHHHVLPRSLGGQDTTDNLVIACRECHEAIHAKGKFRLVGNADDLKGVAVQRPRPEGWVTERWI